MVSGESRRKDFYLTQLFCNNGRESSGTDKLKQEMILNLLWLWNSLQKLLREIVF